MILILSHHSNLGALAQLVKDNSRNYAQQTQQLQNLQSQMQLQQQAFIRQPQQVFCYVLFSFMFEVLSPLSLASRHLVSKARRPCLLARITVLGLLSLKYNPIINNPGTISPLKNVYSMFVLHQTRYWIYL